MKQLLIILSVAALVLTGCKKESNDAIKVACNLPMTGYIGYYGEWIQHGLEMGRADIEAETNELGIKFDFDYQDNKGETKDAITIFQKQSMANPDVYMSGITTQTMSILDQIHKKGLLQVMWSWTPLELDANQKDFRCWVNYGIEGKHIAEYLLSKNPQKVAYLHLDILGAKVQCDDVVVPALKKQNPNINIYVEEFPVETSNFRDIAAKVKNFDADVIMVSGFKEHILNITKDFQAYNIDKKKVLCSMDLLDALDEASDEVLEDFHSVLGVLHLRMELNSPDRSVLATDRFMRTSFGMCDDLESLRDDLDLVVVGCPYCEFIWQVPEEVVMVGNFQRHCSEFGSGSRAECPAEVLGEELHSGAYAEDREVRFVEVFPVVAHRSPFGRDIRRPSG